MIQDGRKNHNFRSSRLFTPDWVPISMFTRNSILLLIVMSENTYLLKISSLAKAGM